MNRHLHHWTIKLAIAAFLFSAAQVRASEVKPDCYILSVGVDIYKYARNLNGCANDGWDIRNLFQSQQGKLFGKVEGPPALVNEQATKDRIEQEMDRLGQAGKAGDYIVLNLSGHGGRQAGVWFFLPHDFNHANSKATRLDESRILTFVRSQMAMGKNVLVILDACFAGQFRLAARPVLSTPPERGALILMVSSAPSQTSSAGATNSSFTKALLDGLRGGADLNSDGTVTLQEIRLYAYHRVYDIQRANRVPGMKVTEQDGECLSSPGLNEGITLARAQGNGGSGTGGAMNHSQQNNPAPTSGQASPPITAKDLYGTWSMTRVINGKIWKLEIRFVAPGLYRIQETIDGRLVEETAGEFRIDNGVLHLENETIVDTLVIKIVKGEMLFQFQGKAYSFEKAGAN